MGAELLFKMKPKGAKDARADFVFDPHPLAEMFETAAEIAAQVRGARADVLASLIPSAETMAEAVEAIRRRGDEWAAAFESIPRLGLAGHLIAAHAGLAASRAVARHVFNPPDPPPPVVTLHVHTVRVVAEGEPAETADDFLAGADVKAPGVM